jgi:hypothetical protein
MSHSSRSRKRRTTASNPGREVHVGVVPYKSNCSRLGVLIKDSAQSNGLVMPTDEARYLARDETDPRIKRHLIEVASFIDNPPEEMARKFEGQIEPVPPTMLGPEALKAWLIFHRELWQEAFRESQEVGMASDVIMTCASPLTQSLDDPPVGFHAQPRILYRLDIIRRVPCLMNPFALPPRPGYFHCFATAASGRFQGSIEALLAISDDDSNRTLSVDD